MPQSKSQVEIPAVDDHATWDEKQGVFRVTIDGSSEFAAMAILPNAPLLLSHLDTSTHNKTTALGDELQARLQTELASALDRHGHQVGTGITLLTHEQMNALQDSQ